MKDSFGRNINYMRISVTDRCNLRCFYCMPPEGIEPLCHEQILSFEEIVSIVKIATEFGINKIRLTGGEPLVRRDIATLVKKLAEIKEITDLSLTTNGILLEENAANLKAAGLHRVNVSLDTTDVERFAAITCGGDIKKVFAGIDAAFAAGLLPIKLNCTIKTSPAEADAQLVQKYAEKKGLEVRFIKIMDLQTGIFSPVVMHGGGDCKNCNRLRLLSDGKILSCLFSDKKFDTKTLGIYEAILQAIQQKPEKGEKCKNKWMCNIGG